MSSIILASSNNHKAQEFSKLFKVLPWEIKAAPISLVVEETGSTFSENALLKSKSYFDRFKSPIFSDDSGLVIEALPDILGVQSARFYPESDDYKIKCAQVLELMKDFKDSKRAAYFVCVLCFYLSDEEVFFFEGRLQGKIAQEVSGSAGFGYDSIFIPEGQSQSLAEIPEWKELNSHRAKACGMAEKFLTGYCRNP
mgnify:FL=1